MSLVARQLEAAGIPTLCLASALDIIEAGRPPRAAFVDYPLGHTCGKAFDPQDQYEIVRGALKAFAEIDGPGKVVDLGRRWAETEDWKATAMDASGGDSRSPRDTTPRYQTEEDRLLAEARAGRG